MANAVQLPEWLKDASLVLHEPTSTFFRPQRGAKRSLGDQQIYLMDFNEDLYLLRECAEVRTDRMKRGPYWLVLEGKAPLVVNFQGEFLEVRGGKLVAKVSLVQEAAIEPPAQYEHDEALEGAQGLAQFFNGVVFTLDDEEVSTHLTRVVGDADK
jgi:hypothetical protein